MAKLNRIIKVNNLGDFSSSLTDWTAIPGSEVTIKKSADSDLLIMTNFSYRRTGAVNGQFCINYEIDGGLYTSNSNGLVRTSGRLERKTIDGLPILLNKNQATEVSFRAMICLITASVTIEALDPAMYIIIMEI